ncbi:RILP-like protein homolog [Lytechinus pictus]|uniref:RILP-like protein homolog n=1 Tax=Lytechinus pictus TaxID=7653 RepID=UPI0030B9B477
MLKTTLKLDAICAKLSKGVSGLPPQEEPCTGAALPGSNGSPRYTRHLDQEASRPDIGSNLKTFHNGDIAPNCSAQLPTVQATENNGYVIDERPEYNRFVERNGGDDSRCSSPKVLSGASKRKARQRATRVATQEADSPSDWDDGSINSFQDCDESLDSGVVDSHQDEAVNGLDHWDEEQEETADSEFTQEHYHDENISMQNIPFTHATNHKANNGNKLGHDDPSSSSKEMEIAPYKVAGHELRTRSGSKVPTYDESGLSDEDVAAEKATYDPRAIMEYAERSWCNENGTEIEEGLETNGVVCDLEESGRSAQGQEGKPRRRRGRPSKSEQMKLVGERDQRIIETQGLEEDMSELPPPEQAEVEQEMDEVQEEQVEYVDDLESEEQGERSETSASPPPATSSKMGKDSQMVPGAPYDVEGLEAVKEYATDTMKEFLGMYGYMEEGAPARDEDLPIEHIRKSIISFC